ncbi:MAG: Terminase-like family protein [Lentisphaerae bacterium ADurb.Bin242]|nr:MAG: Terminase-like family protein [Lentisphaerae bacterium ADurb.Bin242]
MGLKFNEKQKKAWALLASKGKTRFLFDGGSRSGKTVLITEYLVRRALQFPGSRQLAARKHKTHAKASLWNDTFRRYLSAGLPRSCYRMNETELTICFKNGSRIVVGGLDDSDRMEKILGNEYITVFLNEATQLSYEAMQMAVTRLAQKVRDARGREAVPKLILDCNPRGPRHWLHYVGVRHVDPDTEIELPNVDKWVRLNWSAHDNRENLPAEYLAALEALPELMRDRMLNGIWRDNQGAVYEEFDEDLHGVEPFPIPDDWKKVRAIDFGFTNPFVCLWGALDPDGRLYLYREHYQAAVRTAEHARKILELSGNERYGFTAADHDAAERAELSSAGIRTEAAFKEVTAGIQSVKNRLAKQGDGKPRLFFFNTLKNTLSEIYDYRWAQGNDSRNAKEEPVKLNDHAMDALRYMVAALDRRTGGEFRSASAPARQSGRW